jgi:hypothetical protein
MDAALTESGSYEVEGVLVAAAERIPATLFEEAQRKTLALFGFSIDWVPGFFINPRFGWFFGGCCYYFYPDFFALFIIRKSFAQRARWLIYSRTELLAHELCHVARIGMASVEFEETLAYRTATSAFRRMAGSIFRHAWDTHLLLASTLLLLLAEVLRSIRFPRLWAWPFWTWLIALLAFLGLRHARSKRVFHQAQRNLEAVTGEAALPLLFRCNDAEIRALARLGAGDELQDWLALQTDTGPRWDVIRARFVGDRCESAPAPGAEPDKAPRRSD